MCSERERERERERTLSCAPLLLLLLLDPETVSKCALGGELRRKCEAPSNEMFIQYSNSGSVRSALDLTTNTSDCVRLRNSFSVTLPVFTVRCSYELVFRLEPFYFPFVVGFFFFFLIFLFTHININVYQ